MPARELSARAWAALIAVYIVWGSTYLAIKYVVETMPPLLTAGVRFLIAGGLLYGFGVVRGHRPQRPTASQWRAAFIIGTALCLGGNGLVNLAEERPIASGTVALLIATVPLWLAALDRIVFGARLRAQVVLGLVIGFGGAALLVRPPGDGGAVDLTGALLTLTASAIWAGGSLYARGADLPKRPAISTGMEMIGGGVALLVAGVARGEIGDVDVARFSTDSLVAFVYLITAGSLIGFTAYVWLIRNVRTTIAGTYAFVNPLVAVLLGFLFRGEELTVSTAIAGAVIVVGVALIVTTAAPPSPDEPVDLASERLAT